MTTTRNAFILASLALAACASPDAGSSSATATRLAAYTTVALTIDSSALTPKERQMLPILMEAAREMDPVFRAQVYASYDSLLAATTDSATRRLIAINYGPWDKLANDSSFIPGIGSKPEGSNLYPANMTKAEFEAAVAKNKTRGDSLKDLYTLVRRGKGNSGGAGVGNDPGGELEAVPYHVAFKAQHEAVAAKLREAAALAEDAGLKKYLTTRAEALLTDKYQPSDLAWMEMKSNTLDIVIGPIETYEDGLFGYKAAHEAYVLIKDKSWSARLSKYAALLPGLQRGIPVDEKFKKEKPGTDSDLNAYDAVYYAGEANSGPKTIAINLPNDEEVQLKKGTRRLQLKNVIRAKFEKILVPIATELIATDQASMINFDSFFENVMFHEVAHGLGIKRTLDGKSTVREALKERASALEEGKADILGLYMVQKLIEQGEIKDAKIENNYVDFLASLFRSSRFGGTDAHGRANIVAFNFLLEQGAFTRDAASGRYKVDFVKFPTAMNALVAKIIAFQGEGDYEGVGKFNTQYGTIGTQLRADLDRLNSKGIPVDIVFEQAAGKR
jgi:hypothetical protein